MTWNKKVTRLTGSNADKYCNADTYFLQYGNLLCHYLTVNKTNMEMVNYSEHVYLQAYLLTA